ncbi:hypothetical protein QWI17_15225 [Gilvimarinus sp. SDUM040013]|uniref:Tetratricopeptide repeat protein n=1 Tax=Gilvimarinus gilvus TaxID=3058038 RepID=A0ABU4S0S6_9GAMM|nr:tetratricopeptide repeat protein [Gilvimarinus sp. SDUM040013]MDO3387193.1 hypothetical protein [Gilvimarinus sp. SDUM040013]MDX6850756.1 hypothetical protein [Gilvimarinus sp. SDUM040013]
MRSLILIIALLLTAVSFASVPLVPNASDDLGVQLFEKAKYAPAEAHFNQLLAAGDHNIELAHAYLAKLAILRNDGDTALEHIDATLAIAPNLAEELTLAAEANCTKAMHASIFSALKYGKKCGRLYTQAAEEFPTNIKAIKHAFLFHMEAPSMAGGSEKSARKYLTKLNAVSEEDARIANIMMATENDGQEAGKQLAEKYFSMEFSKPENIYELGILYRDNGEYAKAVELFNRLTEMPNTNDSWHKKDAVFQIGEISITQLDKPIEGIQLIEQYLETSNDIYDRHYFWARWRLARAYQDQGDTDGYNTLIAEIESEDYSFNEPFTEQFEQRER